jgi:uncharacterized protein
MSSRQRAAAGALVMILMHALTVQAASFDCKGAKSAIEKMICSDVRLSQLDEDLGSVYTLALTAAPDPETLKREQREWVKNNRNRCASTGCLYSSYESRLAALKEYGTNTVHGISLDKISGTWLESKPTAAGQSTLIIKKGKLRFSLCKKRTFKLNKIFDDKYIFTATVKGKCLNYLNTDELNVIKISIKDEERISVEFYSGIDGNELVGINPFFKIE